MKKSLILCFKANILSKYDPLIFEIIENYQHFPDTWSTKKLEEYKWYVRMGLNVLKLRFHFLFTGFSFLKRANQVHISI